MKKCLVVKRRVSSAFVLAWLCTCEDPICDRPYGDQLTVSDGKQVRCTKTGFIVPSKWANAGEVIPLPGYCRNWSGLPDGAVELFMKY